MNDKFLLHLFVVHAQLLAPIQVLSHAFHCRAVDWHRIVDELLSQETLLLYRIMHRLQLDGVLVLSRSRKDCHATLRCPVRRVRHIAQPLS